MEPSKRRYARALLGLYLLLLVWMLLVRPQKAAALPYWQSVASHIHLVPFRTIRHFWGLLSIPDSPWLHRIALENLLGNAVLMLPLGWLLPTISTHLRGFLRTMATVVVAVALLELAQALLLVGSCDVDDLLLNSLGAALGYGLYRLFTRPPTDSAPAPRAADR